MAARIRRMFRRRRNLPEVKNLAPAPHPLASVAGSFRDDPLWDEMIEEMRIAEASGMYDSQEEFMRDSYSTPTR